MSVVGVRPSRRPAVRQAAATAYPTQAGAKTVRAPTAAKSNSDLWRWFLSPEVWAVANRVASGVRRVSFFPAVDQGDGVPGDRCPPVVNPDGSVAEGVSPALARDAAAVWSLVRSPLGSKSDLFGMEALCLSVAGDAIQFGYPAAADLTFDPDGDLSWVAFARSALEERSGQYVVDVGAEAKITVPPQTAESPGGRLFRIWEPDPRAPAQAVVWTQAVRDPLAHLTMIYEAVAACALSRLNAGLILAPSDQDPPPVPAGAELDEARKTLGAPLYSRLVDLFADHVELSQLEQDGFSRAVPAALGLDSTLIEKVRWLELAHNLDPELGERIDDLRQRVLLASPLPIEVVAGMSNLSGLGGGSVADRITEDEYQKATVPVCERVAQANTQHLLREALSLMGHDRAAVQSVRIGYSADELLMKPDRSEQAIQLASLPIPMLTPDETRDAAGLSEYEGPDEATQRLMLAERLVMAQPAYAHLLEFLGLPPVPGAATPTPAEAEPPAIDAASTERQAAAPPPLPGDDTLGRELVDIATRYEDAVAVLFGAIIDRMVERAGARVASLAKRSDWAEVRGAIKAAPVGLRGSVPGVNTRLAAADVDDDDLLGGALATFAPRFAELTTKAQRRAVLAAGGDWDDQEPDAEHASAAAWALAGTLLIGEARRRFDGREPEGGEGEGAGLAAFAVPAMLVRRVSAVAGGAVDPGATGSGSTLTALTSIADGPLAQRAVTDGGRRITGYIWDYRPEIERNSYEPHLDLHGVSAPDEDGFGGELPGDHRGCECITVMVTEPVPGVEIVPA